MQVKRIFLEGSPYFLAHTTLLISLSELDVSALSPVQVKRIFLEGNPYFLALTMVVSCLHSGESSTAHIAWSMECHPQHANLGANGAGACGG